MNSFYKLIEGLDLIYSNLYSFLSFYSNTAVEHLRLPRFYYINISKELISIIVFDKFVYKSLLSHIFVMLNNFSLTRFIKLRVKGLGYEVRECTSNIHAFCFNWRNYIYLFSPACFMLRSYKKRFLIMSKNWFVLKLILNHILDLKRVGPYELRGIRLSKTIILKKKSGKKT